MGTYGRPWDLAGRRWGLTVAWIAAGGGNSVVVRCRRLCVAGMSGAVALERKGLGAWVC